MQTRKHTRVKDTREDHSRGALASKRYTRGPLARSTCERTLHARTTRSYSTRASRTRGSAASGTLHLGGTVYQSIKALLMTVNITLTPKIYATKFLFVQVNARCLIITHFRLYVTLLRIYIPFGLDFL